jgi:hypothetical protein
VVEDPGLRIRMWKMVTNVEDRGRASVASIANQIEQGELENLRRWRIESNTSTTL